MTSPTDLDPTELPATIRTFLEAHTARDTPTAIETFAADAVVVAEGRAFHGTEEVLGFLQKAGSEFTYTTQLTGAERVDDEHWVARVRLEGDFPGGVADLAYRFTTAGDRITKLVIAP